MSDEQQAPERKPWPPNRVWLPDGVVNLAAVSPELENVDGAYWIRESSDLAPAEGVAREIVRRVCDAALELAYLRHDLTSDQVDVDADADVKERVAAHEAWLEDVKRDVLNCLTGDDTGCLDPEELDESNCELLFVQKTFTSAQQRGAELQREVDAHAVHRALTYSDDIVDDRPVPFDDLAMRDRALAAIRATGTTQK